MQIETEQAQPRRARDPEATKRDILDAALTEFSESGLSGARVDAIAARTHTTVRMIYYYFTSKDELYRAVLEQCYRAVRQAETALRLETMSPEDAIQCLVEFIFDYHEANPHFSRLVTIENIHHAEHMARSDTLQTVNATVIGSIAAILARGKEAGLFRLDAEPIGLHLLMTAFCFFRVSNRHTLGTIFGMDPLSPALRPDHRRMIVDSVLGYLRRTPGS
jgi:AcrR family transcriptional regulator